MNDLFDRLTELDPALRGRLFDTVIVIAVLVAVRYAILRLIVSRIEEPDLRFRLRKIVTYVTVILGLLLVARSWSDGISQLGAFVGLVTAGLAIALNKPLTNLAGWLFILWRRPFRLGDRVQVGAHAGDITDIRLFQFSILEIGNWVDADQYTGRVIHIPNSVVFDTPQANYGTALGLIWNELPVMVTFESDWGAAKLLLAEIVERHDARREAPRSDAAMTAPPGGGPHAVARLTGPATVVTSVADSGVVLTMRYLCRADRRRSTAEQVWEDVLTVFGARDDIDFAYPTTRYYSNVREGKPGARAE